jgi:hypothetical protein
MVAIALVLSLVSIDPSAGTAGFDFLRVTPTAREAAMGGASIAHAEGPLAGWHSPAHAVITDGQRAQLGYVNYVAGIHIGSAAYSQPVGDDKGVGVGIVYLNSGTMKRTDPLGNELGTFGVSFADVCVSGGYEFSFARLGFGLQGLYGSIDTFFAVGLAANVGASFDIPVPDFEGLRLGVVARNLGYQVKAFQSGRDAMPMEFGAGLGFHPDPRLNIVLDVLKPLDNRLHVKAGIEGWVGDHVVLRAGYNSLGPDLKSGGGADILAGVSTGLGFRYQGYQLDYCFIPMVELGMAHRFSFTLQL